MKALFYDTAPPPAAQQQGQGQGGGEVVAWRVPVVQSPFGEWLDHGVRDGLVLVMHRGTHGWKAAGQGHALLAHQLYVKNVEPLCATSHEVAVVGLSGGGWRTVWARSDDDVTHPAPPSAPVGVEGLPRYGFPNGDEPRPVPCADGYWTPWHLAQQPAAVNDLNARRAAFVAERAMRYREGGMAIEQARIHAETDAAHMEALAASQQPTAVDEAMVMVQKHDALILANFATTHGGAMEQLAARRITSLATQHQEHPDG